MWPSACRAFFFVLTLPGEAGRPSKGETEISKVTIARIGSGYRSSNALNNDFEIIEEAFENTLSRDGTGPNHMEAPLDMNNNRVINVGEPVEDFDLVRKVDVQPALDAAAQINDIIADTEQARDDAVQAADDAEIAKDQAVAATATKLDKLAALSGLPALGSASGQVSVQYRSAPGDGYAGTFEWVSGDQSANVTADPAQGIWVAPSSAPTGASGAWKRVFTNDIPPQWFGARTEDTSDSGMTANTLAFNNWLNYLMATGLDGYVTSGRYFFNGPLPKTEGVTIRAGGSGFWRATPFGFATPDLFVDPSCVQFIVTGTGPRNKTYDYITEGRQCGFDRTNPERPHTNAFDAEFLMLDLTNRNASGVTPATLKPVSVFWEICDRQNENTTKPVRISNLMIILDCPDNGEVHGAQGYGNQTAVVPFADWDFGMVISAAAMSRFENLSVVGYWRERGVLVTPQVYNNNVTTQGQGEHVRWDGGYIQGGLSLRSGDLWPITAKTADTLTIKWTPSHRFTSTGSLRIPGSSNVTYTGTTYDGGLGTLTFTGCSSTASVTVGTSYIQFTENAGISHTSFNNMYIADQGYATRIVSSDPALGANRTQFRAAVEASGQPTRALKLNNVTPMTNGPVVFHFGNVQNVEMWETYTEPKSWVLTPGGANQTQGALFIAGPKASMASGMPSEAYPSLESHGINFTSYVNRQPLVNVNPSARLAAMTDVFNPLYYYDERLLVNAGTAAVPGTPSNTSVIQSLNGQNIDIRRRSADGTSLRVIAGFPSSGNTVIGPANEMTIFPTGNATLTGEFRPQTIRLQQGSGPGIYSGAGSPEGVITASIGSIYLNTTSGGPNYRKNTGTGNTGWVAWP